MLAIEEVQLDVSLPVEAVGIVVMQPFARLCGPGPYYWSNDEKDKQTQGIARTLEIAGQAKHGCGKTHFTVFPEYSIPGLPGIDEIQKTLQGPSWSNGTMVIGGVDGLSKSQYTALCNESGTNVHDLNRPEKVEDHQWVNCCVTWVKLSDGSLTRWIQPKLSASWPERSITNKEMFEGGAVHIFTANLENQTQWRFLSLICFDWIGPIGPSHGVWAVLFAINDLWKSNNGRQSKLNLVFVPQRNDKPNYRSFMENARDYLEKRDQYPFVDRDDCAILFANTAGGASPGKYAKYGYTSLILSPLAPYDNAGCPPTFALHTRKLRNTDGLGRCKEALFREVGACIHSFALRLPSFVGLSVADRCWPMEQATVHAVDDDTDDPRTPNKRVPASVKWVNDQLDEILPLHKNEPLHPLRDEIAKAHKEVCTDIRHQSGDSLCRYIELSLVDIKEQGDKWIRNGRKIHNVDHWDDSEKSGLRIIIAALSVIGACQSLQVSDSRGHATLSTGGKVVDVFVVSGTGTHDNCYDHLKSQYPGSASRYTLVITRDEWDELWDEKFGAINDPGTACTEPDQDITDPASGFRRCGHKNLLECCKSANLPELRTRAKAVIGV